MSGADELDKKALSAGYVCVGAMRGAHGVKGLVRVASFTEQPKSLFGFDDLRLGVNFEPVTLVRKSANNGLFLCAASNVRTREEGQALKGERIYAARSAFEALEAGDDGDGEDFYHADLIGLEAYDLNDGRVGFVRSVEDFGAGDLLEVVLDEPVKGLGRVVFIPFTLELVPVVDIKSGRVGVDMVRWGENQVMVRPEEQTSDKPKAKSGKRAGPKAGPKKAGKKRQNQGVTPAENSTDKTADSVGIGAPSGGQND